MKVSLSQVLFALAAFLSGTLTLAKVIDSWLIPSEKTKLKERTIAVWYNFGNSEPLVVIQTPLRFVEKTLSLLYGPSIFSWKALRRSTFVSVVLLLASLGITGLFLGTPFAMTTTPWQSFEESFSLIDKVITSEGLQKEWQKPENKAGKELILNATEKIKLYHTSQYRTLYNVSFVLFVLALNAIMDFGCLVVARLTLRDMVKATTLTTIGSLALTNGFAFVFVYSVCLMGVASAAMPATWIVVWGIFWIVRHVGVMLGLCFVVPAGVAALLLSPPWVEVAAVNAAMPGLLVVFLSVLALACFPLRRMIHDWVLKLLDRATMHEKGVLGFLILLVGVAITVISGLAYWMIKAPLI